LHRRLFDGSLGTRDPAMSVSLPTFRKEGSRFVHVPDVAASRAASLMDKHSSTISRLREKLGFQKDETVIAWLLEQIEQAPDLGTAIYKLLEE
jgi:hypothetical protein